MRRKPAVAGQFYKGTAEGLKAQVAQYLRTDEPKEQAKAILSPHAGLVYSGPVAGEVYSRILFPKTFILMGPNHTGLGAPASLMASGEWEIPNALFQIDQELAMHLLNNTPLVAEDSRAHMFEHSLEVQLPFISYFSHEVKIVPLSIVGASLKECEALGKAIAQSIKEVGYEVVIVASSDMSHYVSDETARKLDMIALDRVVELDPEGLYAVVKQKGISMCGFVPATIMLFAAKELGAERARIVKYATSGEVSGDYDTVVGYAGVIVN